MHKPEMRVFSRHRFSEKVQGLQQITTEFTSTMSHCLDEKADTTPGCMKRSALLTTDKASPQSCVQSCVHHPARQMQSLEKGSMGDAVLGNKVYVDR